MATKYSTTKAKSSTRKTATKKAARAKAAPTAKPAKAKKFSAVDAAAKVLSESKQPMNAKQLIDAMAARKLWTSPGGKTPHLTLYSAIAREIQAKGKAARFTKAERGTFVAKT